MRSFMGEERRKMRKRQSALIIEKVMWDKGILRSTVIEE
jgi:hypothetical protein